MFSKASGKDRTASGPSTGTSSPVKRTGSADAVPSIVSPDTTVNGNLESQGDVQLDGRVQGDVSAQSLTIGERGSVHGTVMADVLKVCGEVVGEIQGGTVTLAASAKVDGDIVHDSLAIEPGAHLNGHCRRRGSDTADAKAPRRSRNTPAAEAAAEAPAGAEPSAADGHTPPANQGTAGDAQAAARVPKRNGSAAPTS
jgi:cytoskeletal protein CcmA (bactofilin family)